MTKANVSPVTVAVPVLSDVATFEGPTAEAESVKFAAGYQYAEVEHIGVVYRVAFDPSSALTPSVSSEE